MGHPTMQENDTAKLTPTLMYNLNQLIQKKKVERKKYNIEKFHTFVLEVRNSGYLLHFMEIISVLYVLQFSKSGVL